MSIDEIFDNEEPITENENERSTIEGTRTIVGDVLIAQNSDNELGNLTVEGTFSCGTFSCDTVTINGAQLGAAATMGVASSVAPAQPGLISGTLVYLYIDALRLPQTYAQKTHAHPLSEIYWGGNMPYEAATVITSASTNGQLATGKAVYDYVEAAISAIDSLSTTGTISITDGNEGPQPTSGTEDSVPTVGAVVDYVSENYATITALNTAKEEITDQLEDEYATLENLNDVCDMMANTYAPASHSHTLSDLTDVGTAASKDTGTNSGNIPVIGVDGKLASTILPAIAITDTFEADTENEMLSLSGADKGDICIRTDINKTFILSADGYDILSNWKELKTPTDAVISVNGTTGAITQADLGLETSLNSSSDTTFPSSKAVAGYVGARIETLNLSYNYAAKNHTHGAGAITSGTVDSARLPKATTSQLGIVKIGTGLSVSTAANNPGLLSVDYNTVKTGLGLGSAAYVDSGGLVLSGNTGLVTGDTVYSYITSLNLPNTYAAKSHTHLLTLSNISYTNTGPGLSTQYYSAGTTITSSSTEGQLATAKAVYEYAAPISHNHTASSITSGTIAGARLPVDGVSVVLDGANNLSVDGNFIETSVMNLGLLTSSTAQQTYLKNSITGISVWSQSASYSIGDIVLNRGEIYRATTTSTAKEPYSYYLGVIAVWEKITLDAANRYETSITGTGSIKEFTISHNLGFKYCDVTVVEDETDTKVYTGIRYESDNELIVIFDSNVEMNKVFRVLVRK